MTPSLYYEASECPNYVNVLPPKKHSDWISGSKVIKNFRKIVIFYPRAAVLVFKKRLEILKKKEVKNQQTHTKLEK